jgi:hypothetical protein
MHEVLQQVDRNGGLSVAYDTQQTAMRHKTMARRALFVPYRPQLEWLIAQ